MRQTYEDLLERLQSKEYREAFTFEHVAAGIPMQIRALRKHRKMSQQDLASAAKKTQSWISTIENDDKASYTIHTLREIASAFDVALMVKFVPFSKFLREFRDVSPEGMRADSFKDDLFARKLQ